MKRCVRTAALLLVLVLLGLCGCSARVSTAQSYAARAWTALGRKDSPASIACMHYTAAEQLAVSQEKPDATIALIPCSGYVYVIAPETGHALEGLALVFVTDEGKVSSVVRYDRLMETFDGTGYAEYLNAANYVMYVYLSAADGGIAPESDERIGQWYRFTDAQLKTILSV